MIAAQVCRIFPQQLCANFAFQTLKKLIRSAYPVKLLASHWLQIGMSLDTWNHFFAQENFGNRDMVKHALSESEGLFAKGIFKVASGF